MDKTLAALLRREFFPFARKAIRELEGTRIGDEPYLKYLAKELDLFAGGETRRLIINLPPGHCKTLLGSVCLTARLLANDASMKIMVVTHAEHLSKTIARNVRSTLEATWFKNLFEVRIKKGHAEVCDFGTTAGGGVFVTSFGASFTGRRADVIIVDDPHDISHDAAEIESTIESFQTVLLSRLNDRKNGRVLVIAHRIHERDLSAHLLRNAAGWKHVLLPLVATRDERYQTTNGLWCRGAGELLRPDVYDEAVVNDLRANLFQPDFEMLYQQDCDFKALPSIERHDFVTFDMPPSSMTAIVLSVDAGASSRPRSAYSVVQAWCAHADHYYLLDQFRERCDLAELRDAVRRFWRRYRPAAILIERAANGFGLISLLVRTYGQTVIPIDLDGRSKSARFRVHAQKLLDRRICIPAGAGWKENFIQEFVEFPHGTYADQVDAMTQYLDHAAEFTGRLSTPQDAILAVSSGRGFGRTLSRSNAPTDGLVAAVRGNGLPVGHHRGGGPILKITTEVVDGTSKKGR